MDEARASVHAECTPPMSWPLLRVRMLINFLFMYLILLKSAMHRHGRGMRLGTYLVQQQCVSYVLTLQHVSMFRFLGWAGACVLVNYGLNDHSIVRM